MPEDITNAAIIDRDNTRAHGVSNRKVIIIPIQEIDRQGSKSTPREKAKRHFPTHDNFSTLPGS